MNGMFGIEFVSGIVFAIMVVIATWIVNRAVPYSEVWRPFRAFCVLLWVM